MKQYRLNRLFNPRSGRCFDVPVDHGMPGEPNFLTGIEDMEAVVDTLVEAAPDAIQLAVGQAELLQRKPGRDKPALVLRTDTANVYGPEMPEETWTARSRDHRWNACPHRMSPNSPCPCSTGAPLSRC